MTSPASLSSPEYFVTFGDLLKHLRLRCQLTQRELAIALGYNHAHLSRLEHNQRLPDVATVLALFVPALCLDDQPVWAARLVELAAEGRGERLPQQLTVSQTVTQHIEEEELGVLESVPSLPANLVPRRAALEQLRRRLAADRCVALCGMAGMGKTSLAAALAREWPPSEPVFWFTLTPGLAASAESLLHQLALFLVAHGQDQLLPVLHAGAGRERSMPLDQQLAHIMLGLGRTPALLVLDDVHVARADEAWLGTLRRLAQSPARLLLLSREETPLTDIAQLRLGGLAEAEALALIASAHLALEPGLVQRLLSKTAGSPMLLRLALGELQHGPRSGADFIDHLENEPQVTRYLLGTLLRDLPEPAEKLLALLSVFRQPVDLYDEQLVELSQKADGAYDLRAALTELQRRQIVEHPNEARLHPLLHDHVYSALVSDLRRRRALHRAAARWYEQAQDDVLEAAAHYQRAGDLRQAVEVLADRGHSLVNQGQAMAAAEVAERLLAAATGRRDPDGALRRQLLTLHGDMLLNSVRLAEAEADYRQALAAPAGGAQPQPAVWANVALRLIQCVIQRGRMAEALALCEAVAARLAELPTPPTVLLAELAAVTCRAQMNLARYAEAEATARRALALADQCAPYAPRPAEAVRARAWRALGWLSYTREPENSTATLAYYEEARAAAYRAETNWVANACSINIGILQHERGELAAAQANFNEALRQARSTGDDHIALSAEHNLAGLDYLRGNLASALAHTQSVMASYERMGNLSELAAAQEMLGAIYVAAGRLAEARAVLDQARRYHEQNAGGSPRDRGYFLAELAELVVLEGQGQAAAEMVRPALRLPGVAEDARLRTSLENSLALALLAMGDLPAALEVTAAAPPAGIGLEVWLMRQLISGLVALAAGHGEQAARLAGIVAERVAATGCELYRAPAARLAVAAADPARWPVEKLPMLLLGTPIT